MFLGQWVTTNLIDAIIEISEKRRELVLKMRDALVRDREQAALDFARELVDLPRKTAART